MAELVGVDNRRKVRRGRFQGQQTHHPHLEPGQTQPPAPKPQYGVLGDRDTLEGAVGRGYHGAQYHIGD